MAEPSRTILIVDDDKAGAMFISHCLSEIGYQAIVAEDVKAGVDLALHRNPGCILLDCHIGERNSGLVLVRPLRQMAPNAPIVMISSDTSWDTAAESLRQGAFVFWRKTNGAMDLLSAVSVAMDEHCRRLAGERVVTLDEIERDAILERLRANKGNTSQTARELGRSLDAIKGLIHKHGLDDEAKS